MSLNYSIHYAGGAISRLENLLTCQNKIYLSEIIRRIGNYMPTNPPLGIGCASRSFKDYIFGIFPTVQLIMELYRYLKNIQGRWPVDLYRQYLNDFGPRF